MTDVNLRWLNQQDYLTTWEAMQQFTNARTPETVDEIWLLEHLPVFTQGQNGQAQHVLDIGNIPLIKSDRGGQVTYHGPGQLMIYTLIDLKRQPLSIRALVCALERSVIDLLADLAVSAFAKTQAPGVYIKNNAGNDEKLASVGLRIRRGCSYHGMALNVNMDLTPFTFIHPCGFSGLKMTQLNEWTAFTDIKITATHLIRYLIKNLGYTSANYIE